MNVFHCDHCGQLVFFENIKCVNCGHPLAFMPDLGVVGSLEQGAQGLWASPLPRAAGNRYRLCANYTKENVCNWSVPETDEHELCRSCRLTAVVPNLSKPANKAGWFKLESAKRRLVYSLLKLNLPLLSKTDDPERGLSYEFKADDDQTGGSKVLTGHANGVITINVAEADDAERERRRITLHEPYRTLLGHFRHEVGHYYWDRLIANGPRLEAFRALFGDERENYPEALQKHYTEGPPDNWQQRFVSAYSTAHPWEDWAETWAHYLHLVDALETAAACGLSLKPKRKDEPALAPLARKNQNTTFDRLIDDWFPLTYVLNNLNRGLGLADAYPFILSNPAIEKLRFVHDTIGDAAIDTRPLVAAAGPR
jgi:hypothetical protein